MAGFTDTVRGNGLAWAQRALAGLELDPQQLNHPRFQMNDSPPPYSSARSPSPNCYSPRTQRGIDYIASKPYNQFAAQVREESEAEVEEERKRIRRAYSDTLWRPGTPEALFFSNVAKERVRKSWAEQGIWNEKWNEFALGRWKHEESLELESESETDTEAEVSPPRLFLPKKLPKPRRPKSDEEKRRIAERRVVREREREASRPYHQFVYQISKERKRIQDESSSAEGNADINTTAYENVKNTWTKRGIWNKRWGILPGMVWKHEEPFEEETADDPMGEAPHINMNRAPPPFRDLFGHRPTNLLERGTFMRSPSPIELDPLRAASAMIIPPLSRDNAGKLRDSAGRPVIFRDKLGRPTTDMNTSGYYTLDPSYDVESNHQASGAMNTSQQADIDPVGLKNGESERSPSAPNSPRRRMGKWALARQGSRSCAREPSPKEGQPQPVASASLDAVPSLKVSKSVLERGSGPQGPHISQDVVSSAVGTAEVPPLPTREAPRRSNRIQRPVPSIAKDPTRTVSTDPSKRAVRSKPERNIATRSSAKPQGISKTQHRRTTREKARKE